MCQRAFRFSLCIVGLLAAGLAFSEAPVADVVQADNPAAVAAATSSAQGAVNPVDSATPTDLTEEQRLVRLEQQIQNLTQLNLPQQVSDLQEQIATLRGQLEVAQHDLQAMRDSHQNLAAQHAPTSPDAPSTAAVAPTLLKDASAYQVAFNFLENKQYDKAATALGAYLHDFPHGQYVVNVHYWMGEIYFSQKHNDQAATEFQAVVDQFPQSAKVPDAKLKIAIIHQQAGDVVKARTEFLQIKQQHPGSTAAQLANIRLQQLNEKT